VRGVDGAVFGFATGEEIAVDLDWGGRIASCGRGG
jgi:hypothetical protein